jgi:DNA topoisomerase-3
MRFDHVILTEKPSVAKDVAAALGAASAGSRGEWYESGRIAITWSFGHLLEAFEPHDYNPAWQEWKLELLPVIPANFAFRYKPRSREARQRLRIIGELAQQANTLVDACDAGREGELIFREIIDQVKFPAEKTERMWLNTTTRAGILAAWQARLPSNTAKYENGLELAAQVAPRHGPARPRTPPRNRRGR